MNESIRVIPFGEISEYGMPGKWEKSEVFPITPERASSQARNPVASPDEPCLWIALDEEQRVIAFAGSLPAKDVHNGTLMGWNSCWWADPHRGKEMALPVLFAFLSHWEERVAFSDMTERTHAIIRQLDFCNTREEKVLQSYYRIPAGKILSGREWLKILLSPLIYPLSWLVNLLQDIRLRASVRTGKGPETTITKEPDQEVVRFIGEHNAADFSKRSMDEFGWAMQHPWLVEKKNGNRKTGKRYPFSYLAVGFRTDWVVTRSGSGINSAMLVSERDGILKVLYYFGKEPADALFALRVRMARHPRLHSLIFAHPVLLAAKEKALKTALYTRNRIRYTGVSRKILPEFPDRMVMQLGDGDAIFT